MSGTETVTLLVPTLNERAGLEAIMPQIDPSWYDQLVILDGGSTDGTAEYARAQGWTVHVQREAGLRCAYREVWPLLTGDIVVTFSPDGNSLADRLPPLVAKIREGYDMVIVSRYLDGAHSDDDGPITGFGNWMFTRLINACFGGMYTDAMVMYRAYRRDVPQRLGLFADDAYTFAERPLHTRVSWEPLLSMRAARAGLRCTEIPGDEPVRLGGERKLQIVRWGTVFLAQIVRERLLAPPVPGKAA